MTFARVLVTALLLLFSIPSLGAEPLTIGDLRVGMAGTMPLPMVLRPDGGTIDLRVHRIVDGNTLLLKIQFFDRAGRKSSTEKLVCVSGFDTTGKADDERVFLIGNWEVTGTRMFEFPPGDKRTLHVLEPVKP